MNDDPVPESLPVASELPLPKDEIWLHRHSAAIQAGCAALGLVIASVTLAYLVRYSNDTRRQTNLSQKQFDETQLENKAHRLLDYQRLLNEDNAEMPDITISTGASGSAPKTDLYVFLTIFNASAGEASDFALYDQTAQKVLFGGLSVKAHGSITISVPKAKWVGGHLIRLFYLSPHGSARQQTIVFTGVKSFNLLGDSIARPYAFLVHNGDYTTIVPGDGKTPQTIFGSGRRPAQRLYPRNSLRSAATGKLPHASG